MFIVEKLQSLFTGGGSANSDLSRRLHAEEGSQPSGAVASFFDTHVYNAQMDKASSGIALRILESGISEVFIVALILVKLYYGALGKLDTYGYFTDTAPARNFLSTVDRNDMLITVFFLVEITFKLCHCGVKRALQNFWLLWDAVCIYIPVVVFGDATQYLGIWNGVQAAYFIILFTFLRLVKFGWEFYSVSGGVAAQKAKTDAAKEKIIELEYQIVALERLAQQSITQSAVLQGYVSTTPPG